MSSATHANKKFLLKTRDPGLYCGVKNKILYNKRGAKTKNQEVVGAMYAMYCLPRSLEQIGRAYRKSRQTIYFLFKSRGYKMRSKRMLGILYLDGIRFTLTKRGYHRGTLDKKRILMHRYIWEKKHGPAPEGYYVCHRDGNKDNNCLRNLHLVKKKKDYS